MKENNKLRQLEIHTALFGLWNIENQTFSFFFHPETVEIIIAGIPTNESKYEVFINEENESPYLKILNHQHPTDDLQIKEYQILKIETKEGILILKSDLGVEMKFQQQKFGF